MDSPVFSVLISTRNEGERLRRTVDDVLRSTLRTGDVEIIIVDDGSDDRSVAALDVLDRAPLTVIRNASSRGLVFSRALAADRARGEYLCVLDAHCSTPFGWLDALRETLGQINDRGIVAPVLKALQEQSWSPQSDLRRPARACTIINPLLDFGWSEPTTFDGREVSCLVGGAAWMCHRDWYGHIGGLDRKMSGWGGENLDISLRTWLAGGQCLVASEVTIGHLYPDPPKVSTPLCPEDAKRLTHNKLRAAHHVFAKPTFVRMLKALRYLPGFRESVQRIRDDAEDVARIRSHVESVRERSDEWLVETFRLPLFETPFFHRPSGKPSAHRQRAKTMHIRSRPLVTVIVDACRDGQFLERQITSLLTTAYGNYEVLIVKQRRHESRTEWCRSSRCRWLESNVQLGAGRIGNLASMTSDAEYLVHLTEGVCIVDEHWLEEFIHMFEQRTQLLLASPGLRPVSAEMGPVPERRLPDRFDVHWDWDRPGFVRDRCGEPREKDPYQALSCPASAFVVHRERFVELGGFDRSLRYGPPPVLDLAIRGWLAGYEVYCHPGIQMECAETDAGSESILREQPDAANLAWRDYANLLPAVKYFTNPRRLLNCRTRCGHAVELLKQQGPYLSRRRREFLAYAKHDDDWLFYKFGIDEAGQSEFQRTPPQRAN